MKVYFEGRVPGWKLHSLYNSLFDFPPEGVKFSYLESGRSSGDGSFLRSINAFFSDVQPTKQIIDNLKPSIYYGYQMAARRVRPIPPTDMIYSSQHLIFERIPWVVDLEFLTALVGYGSLRGWKRTIETTLSSKYCKRIMPWTEAGAETLRRGLDVKNFEEKIQTVHIAVPAKKFVKKFSDDKVRLLFVGTGNKFNVRNSFELKGGREAIVAFSRLRKLYPNITLTIRSSVPEYYQALCAREEIRVLPNLLTKDELRNEFEQADIFLFPGHQTPGTVLIDAMSYELPIVATDVWAMSEMVVNKKTGLLTKPSRFAKYHDSNFVPLWGEPTFLRSIERFDNEMIDDIVKKVSYLVENTSERRAMGRAARQEVESGKFSIEERNQKLRRIFEDGLYN